jgi:hypothetical protein
LDCHNVANASHEDGEEKSAVVRSKFSGSFCIDCSEARASDECVFVSVTDGFSCEIDIWSFGGIGAVSGGGNWVGLRFVGAGGD